MAFKSIVAVYLFSAGYVIFLVEPLSITEAHSSEKVLSKEG